jgi:hypothetical protein
MSRVLVPAVLVLFAACSGADRPQYKTSRSAMNGQCPALPKPELFAAGLCVCKDFDVVGDLLVKPLKPEEPGTAGVNGQTHLVGTPFVTGDFIAWAGLDGVGEAEVGGTLATTSTLNGVGKLRVGGDLVVGGDLSGVGELQVDGLLRVGGLASITGDAKLNGLGAYEAPALPCGCGDDQILDIAGKVAEARAKAGNTEGTLPSIDVVGQADLTLGSGSYFFEKVSSVGETTWNIEGGVEIFIDGDLDEVGSHNIKLAPGATLDLYVSGSVNTVGDTQFGGEPGAFRLFIGGKEPIGVSVGNQAFRGTIYAPRAELSFVGDTLIEGTLFAGSVDGVGTLEVRQAGAKAAAAELCTDPDEGGANGGGTGNGGTNPDAGTEVPLIN